ncbi:TolC family protein [Thermophagus xiamenensis]|uniref:Outer membrane protein TolC n=1 Tax=Thermophagus xiamenensis TaxID=385682 RepID=A0A1I2F6L6_9BACT|nr:TolC family protein [Thermophagus xiamenensis]SFF00256.1 Outer membrane protein TolC [Thermophagus xiamenensis]
MKYFLISVLGLSITLNTLLAQPNLFTLKDCWEYSRNHYPLIKGKALLKQSTELNLRNVQTKWLPQMELIGQASWQNEVTHVDLSSAIPGVNFPQASNDQYKIALDLSQTLYDGGRINTQKKVEEIAGEIEQQNIEIELYDLKQRVTELFFQILMLNEKGLQLDQKIKTLQIRKKELQTAQNYGSIEKADIYTLEAEELLTRQQKVALDYSIKALLENLSSYLGRQVSSVSQLVKPDVSDFFQPERRPEYRLFALQKEQSETASILAQRNRWPVLAAFVQGGYGNPGYNMLKDEFDTFMMIGIRLKWKPWDWKEAKRRQLTFNNKSQLVDLRRETFDLNLQRVDSRLSNEISQFISIMELDEGIVKLRQEVANDSEKKLKSGIITSADYVEDLNALINSQINLGIHQLEYLKGLAFKYLVGAGK